MAVLTQLYKTAEIDSMRDGVYTQRKAVINVLRSSIDGSTHPPLIMSDHFAKTTRPEKSINSEHVYTTGSGLCICMGDLFE